MSCVTPPSQVRHGSLVSCSQYSTVQAVEKLYSTVQNSTVYRLVPAVTGPGSSGDDATDQMFLIIFSPDTFDTITFWTLFIVKIVIVCVCQGRKLT